MAVYLFSAPIRREHGGELVELRWRKKGNDRIVSGSTPDSVVRVTPLSVVLEKPRQKFPCFLIRKPRFHGRKETERCMRLI